jgi:hypothetical protein
MAASRTGRASSTLNSGLCNSSLIVKVRSSDASYDREAAEKLWAVSEALTGVSYEV